MSPQVRTLLTHLRKHGSISQAEAATVYRIRALPRRISDLREEGYYIRRELKKDPTGQRYARYYLGKCKVGDTVHIVNPWLARGYRAGDSGVVNGVDMFGGCIVKFPHLTHEVFVAEQEYKVEA